MVALRHRIVSGGSFLVLCSLVRRLLGPNALVALPYLWKGTPCWPGQPAVLVSVYSDGNHLPHPAYRWLSMGFEADRSPAIILERASSVAVSPLTAWAPSPLRRLILLSVGRLPAWHDSLRTYWTSQYTTPGRRQMTHHRTQLLIGVGQSFSLIGLVGCIILQGIFTGGLAKPQWILTFSAFFHTIRLFGGTTGAIYMGHFLAEREKLHSNLLGLHVTQGSWITDWNIRAMTAGLYAKSSGLAAAGGRAVDLIAARLRLQAYTLSLIDGFLLVAWSCVVGLVSTAMLRKSPLNYGDLSALQPVKEKKS